MQTKSWTFLDTSMWGEGPWRVEPDKVQFEDPGTGMPCLAVRGPLGNWCGYVGLEPGHPFYGLDYATGCALRPEPCGESWCAHTPAALLEVHGGLTYSGACQESEHGICHVPSPGEEARLWWLGWDCGHFGDLMPLMMPLMTSTIIPEEMRGTYRPLAYVQAECARLALQLDDRDWETRLEDLRILQRSRVPE